jgi:uncharacterized coiled-coil protein SlyX
MTILTNAEVEDLKLLIADAATMEGFKISDWGTWGYDEEGTVAINNIWNMVDTYEDSYNELLDVSADLIAANATIASQAATIASLNASIVAKDATIADLTSQVSTQDATITTLETEKLDLVRELYIAENGDPRIQPLKPARPSGYPRRVNEERVQAIAYPIFGPLET